MPGDRRVNDFETGRQPVIVTGVRTPFLKSGGAYAALSGHSLAAAPMAELRRRCDLAPDGVDLVTLGMVVQDVDATNAAREAMLSAGFSSRVPAWTVSMAGVSPNVGVGSICDQILLGRVDSALACGADNFSDLPVRFGRSLRQRAVSLATARSLAERLRILAGIRPVDLLPHVPSATDLTTGLTMGECAERMARRFGVDRNDSDAYALRSHRLATEAWTTGRFADEVMAIDLADGSRVERDDTPRSDTTLERLGALRPSFVEDGIITAGNASGLTDGAAALLLMSTAAAARAGHDPLARVIDYQFTGVADLRDEMLLGPAMAIPPLLHRHGLAMQDIEVFELHEAFAAQILANQAALADADFARDVLALPSPTGPIPEARLNAWGGSLALGNPFGGTGIRMLLTAARRLRKSAGRYAVVATCAGGGLGAAILLERPDR